MATTSLEFSETLGAGNMNSTVVQLESNSRTTGWASRISDYVELAKPRILAMVLVAVSLSGIIASWGQPDVLRLIHGIVGTTLVAASASIFNQWLERHLDARMRRTVNRPLPAGRLTERETLVLGSASVLFGLAYLLNLCGRPATFFAAMTWLLYVGVYTPLKTRTWLNTLVGAIPGAMPVLLGWSAVGAELDIRAWCLFLLVFLWQFPHFMAIAWLYRHQYAAASMRMLTVIDPTGRRAGIQSVVAAVSVLIVSLIPAALTVGWSVSYIAGSVFLGVLQVACAIRFFRSRDDSTARRLLRASLIYLPLQLVLVTLLNVAWI